MSTRSQSGSKSRSGSKVRGQKLARVWKWVKRGSIPVLLIAALVGLKLGWDRVKRSEFLKITAISVSGNRHASDEEIIFLSGVKPGMGIFDFKLGKAVQGVEFHPWIKEARVSRQLPDQVLITVSEHSPIAIVILDEAFYVNSEYKVFKRLIPGDSLDYPIFTGLTLEALRDPDSSGLKMLQAGLGLWQRAATSKLFPQSQISEFHLDPAAGLSLLSRKNQQVDFGEDGFEEKFEKLEQICAEVGSDFYWFEELDLSRTDRVVARLMKKAAIVKPEAENQTEAE